MARQKLKKQTTLLMCLLVALSINLTWEQFGADNQTTDLASSDDCTNIKLQKDLGTSTVASCTIKIDSIDNTDVLYHVSVERVDPNNQPILRADGTVGEAKGTEASTVIVKYGDPSCNRCRTKKFEIRHGFDRLETIINGRLKEETNEFIKLKKQQASRQNAIDNCERDADTNERLRGSEKLNCQIARMDDLDDAEAERMYLSHIRPELRKLMLSPDEEDREEARYILEDLKENYYTDRVEIAVNGMLRASASVDEMYTILGAAELGDPNSLQAHSARMRLMALQTGFIMDPIAGGELGFESSELNKRLSLALENPNSYAGINHNLANVLDPSARTRRIGLLGDNEIIRSNWGLNTRLKPSLNGGNTFTSILEKGPPPPYSGIPQRGTRVQRP